MAFISIDGVPSKPPSGHKERVSTQPDARKHRLVAAPDPKKLGLRKRGCEYCPLNKVHGIHKIFGKVKGKEIFIWAQSPGPKENKERKELIGPSGEWLWKELRRVGIKRKHCDIQNVVRCIPADYDNSMYPPLKMRTPAKEEIKCCSVFNETAMEKSKAKLHLVFGAIAAASVLGKEYKKDKRIFYSDKLKSWVVYLDHPSYFIRMGYSAHTHRPANAALKRFRSDLKQAQELRKHKHGKDRYSFLKEQEYVGVTNTKLAKKAYRLLVKKAKEGYRLVADMEEGKVNDKGEPDEKGISVPLCCGWAYKPGQTFVFILNQPSSKVSERCRRLNAKLVSKLFNNSHIKKAFHFGASDTDSVKRLLDTNVHGFDYDTLLGAYFDDPNAKSYGLTALGDRHFPEFQDYKTVESDAFTPDFQEWLTTVKDKNNRLGLPQKVALGRSKNGINLSRLPWEKMVLYNGADCHLTKLEEQRTVKSVNPPLMWAYIDAGHILYRMERQRECQPLFDYHWHKKISKLLKLRVKKLKRKLRDIAGNYAYVPRKKKGQPDEIVKKKFNPNAPEHIKWLLFEKLGYKYRGEDEKDKKVNTRANTLRRMGLKHKKALLVVEYRQATKAEKTYVKGYYKCAELNEGHLRTNWKTTGTSTGRLSSGKTKDNSKGVINFQNIHGDPLIKCLLVSDNRWRDIYDHWRLFGDFTKKTWKTFKDYYVDFGLDFSQNELRQLAEESGDKNLIKMFSSGRDPHVEVGHAITGWSKDKIAHDDRIRKLIKNIQFGLVYGLKGKGLYLFVIAQGVKTTQEEVDRYHKAYFKRFRGVERLQEHYRNFVKKHGYVENVFGFRRKLDVTEKDSLFNLDSDEKTGAFWGNQAINTPIQGAAHQLLLFALAVLHRKPKKYPLLKHPNKEIHDAIYFRLKLKYLWKAIKQGIDLMVKEPVRVMKEDFKMEKKVPLSAKPKAGFRFGVQIEGIGTELKNVWDFLNAWCKENLKLENSYKMQLAELQ
jgi:uracil-DNA glycosylase family 4